MKIRPTFSLRFRDEGQQMKLQAAADEAKLSLNEYLLRKIEGPKADLSRRKSA